MNRIERSVYKLMGGFSLGFLFVFLLLLTGCAPCDPVYLGCAR